MPQQNVYVGSSESMMTMFSPRNLIKYISSSIDDYNSKPKTYRSPPNKEQQLLKSFQPFLNNTQTEHSKYKERKLKVSKHPNQEKHEQIQNQLRLSRVPSQHFQQTSNFVLDLSDCKVVNSQSLRKRQQEINEHLDEIEVLLFAKTAKDPQKYFDAMNIFNDSSLKVEKSLQKVKVLRRECLHRQRQLILAKNKIVKLTKRKQMIEKVVDCAQIIKRIKKMKNLSSENAHDNKNLDKTEILEKVKQKQLNFCSKINSLKDIVGNIQFYRSELKQIIFRDFHSSMERIMQKILFYDRNDWNRNKITPNLLSNEIDNHDQKQKVNNIDESVLNITVLDQSYFAFASDITPVGPQKGKIKQLSSVSGSQTNHQNQQQKSMYEKIQTGNEYHSQPSKEEIEQLGKVWKSIRQFDLYDEIEVNQSLTKTLIKHNFQFNQDLDEYLDKLFCELIEPILEQSEESLSTHSFEETDQGSIEEQNEKGTGLSQAVDTPKKGKKNYFETLTDGITNLKDLNGDLSHLKKTTISTLKRFGNGKKKSNSQKMIESINQQQVNLKKTGHQVLQEQKIHRSPAQKTSLKSAPAQRLSLVDIKLFIKAIKFYYDIISNLVSFINLNSGLQFLHNFSPKLTEFISERVRHFFSLRNIGSATSVSDFLTYMELIDYWSDVNDEVYEQLLSLRQTLIDEYLTSMQKQVLVKELKQAIQKSKFEPISIPANLITSFHYVVNWASLAREQRENTHDLSLSVVQENYLVGESNQELLGSEESESKYRGSPRTETVKENDFKIIDKTIIYREKQFYACETFIILLRELEKYLQLRAALAFYNSNIEEKVCQLFGFYAWFSQKTINSPNRARTLKNICVLYSTLSLCQQIFDGLNISNKKKEKTQSQFEESFKTLEKNLTMTPFLLVEKQISNLYENNSISSQFQIPAKETLKIVQIVKISLTELKLHFSREKIIKILEPTVKIIYKNFFGYLASLGKRGLLELKEFIPKYKDSLLDFGFKKDIQHKTSEGQNSTAETYIFTKQIQQMERSYKQKIALYK